MPVFKASNISFEFADGRKLLHNINLQLEVGQKIVIIGENGSGKSTLLKILAGLIRPTTGKIEITGAASPDIKKQVGIVFQNPNEQMLAENVEAEIALGMELQGESIAVISEKLKKSLTFFHLKELKDRSTQNLSGGQKQRVAIASIMTANPSFLLLDEPDAMLDAPSRNDLLMAIEEVMTQCGILWISSHPLRVPKADNYFLLRDGILEEVSFDDLVTL